MRLKSFYRPAKHRITVKREHCLINSGATARHAGKQRRPACTGSLDVSHFCRAPGAPGAPGVAKGIGKVAETLHVIISSVSLDQRFGRSFA